MESLLAQSAVDSPFTQYANDLSPTERKVFHDYLERLRSTMLAALEDAGIALEVRRTNLRWALQVHLIDLHSSLAELAPSYLAGYGSLSEAGKSAALQLEQTLTRHVDQLHAYLRQGLGRDLGQRLERLAAATAGAGELKTLDKIITRWGLVEFRPALGRIVQRLESPRFEIAVFGRVSSGKSSLLNHLADMDVLPVGVTPITAVPTRLVRGEQPRAIISFAELPARRIEVGDLRQYASEGGNPGNQKHVTDILVQLPAARLQEGIIFVDTPGIGSLALSGSTETYAYLPHCDLGIVLIDAASTLTPEDLNLLRLLAEAGTPAQVVLSKADLLTPADRRRTIEYIRAQIQRELALDLSVHPVSTVGEDESLLMRWFEAEIAPLLARHRSLVELSLRRKIGHLRESVGTVLQTLAAKRGGQMADRSRRMDVQRVRQLLNQADAAIRRARDQCKTWTDDESTLLEIVLQDSAQAIVMSADGAQANGKAPVMSVMQRMFLERGKMAMEVITDVQKALSSTLDALREANPFAKLEPASVKNLVFRGMPFLDHLPAHVDGAVRRPWFASIIPPLAVWQTRRTLQDELTVTLREQISLADRQLLAWLKACLDQLIAAYEDQADFVRQQVQRFAEGPGPGAVPANDVEQLEADLRELSLPQPGHGDRSGEHDHRGKSEADFG
ncbi:MAG: dynamin family protein [Planctomycetes bacterium]|nr:dynamin family protein [Planctomycetota bacterium]